MDGEEAGLFAAPSRAVIVLKVPSEMERPSLPRLALTSYSSSQASQASQASQRKSATGELFGSAGRGY